MGRGNKDHLPVATQLKILSTLAVQGALPALAARYEESAGTSIRIEFAPTNGLLARLGAGEVADIAILTRSAIDDLAAKGVLAADSVADVCDLAGRHRGEGGLDEA